MSNKIWYTNKDRTEEWQVDSLEEIPDWGIPHKRAYRKRPKQSEVMKGHKGYWNGKTMPHDGRGETLHQRYKAGEIKVWNDGLAGDPRCKGHTPGTPTWNTGLTEETDLRVANYLKGWRTGECQKKEMETKKRNNSFNISKPEKALVSYYVDKYGQENIKSNEIIDDRYPFKVDVYIIPEDKFIELDGTWTHGLESFDKTNKEHLNILEKLSERAKTSKYYENAIKTWTVRDPLKLEYVNNNNLNFEKITYKNTRKQYIFSNGIIIDKNK